MKKFADLMNEKTGQSTNKSSVTQTAVAGGGKFADIMNANIVSSKPVKPLHTVVDEISTKKAKTANAAFTQKMFTTPAKADVVKGDLMANVQNRLATAPQTKLTTKAPTAQEVAAFKANPPKAMTPQDMVSYTNKIAKGDIESLGGNANPTTLERIAGTVSGATKDFAGTTINAIDWASKVPGNPLWAIKQYNDLFVPDALGRASDKLVDSGAQDREAANRGASGIGKTAMDVGAGALQIAGDIGLALATGGGSIAPMVARSFGSAAKQAENRGGSELEQGIYGGLSAATAGLVGKLANVGGILSKAYGKGALDGVLQKATSSVISKLIKNGVIFDRVSTFVAAGAGESLEEMLESALSPLYQRLTYDPNAKWNAESILYDGLVSFLVGGIAGGVGGSNTQNTPQTPTENVDINKIAPNVNPLTPNLAKPAQNASQQATQPITNNIAPNLVKLPTLEQNAADAKRTASEAKTSYIPLADNKTNNNDVLTESYKSVVNQAKNVTPETVDLDNLPEMGIGVAMNGNKTKTSISDKLSNAYTRVVDTQSPIADKFSKDAKDKSGVLASNSRNAGGIVNYIFTDNLVDTQGNVIGKSFKEVANSIPKGEETTFWKYMAQRHNIDRAAEGKNVDPTYTSEMSQKYVENTESKNPNYKAIGDDVVNWIDSFEKAWGVDSGLIGKDTYASLREKYKSYFPTQREFSDLETGLPREITRQFVDPKSPIRTATGSSRDLNNPIENIMSLVNTRVKAARYNAVGQEILNSVRKNPEGLKKYAEIVSEDDATSKNLNNIVSVIENGERVYLKINDKPFLEALMGLPKNTTTIPVLSDLTQGFKNLITQKNPFFAIRNTARDVPTAYIYGSEANPLKFAGGLLKAGKDVVTNSENYQRYKAVGGGMSNFFNSGNVEKSAVDLTKVGKRDTVVNGISKTVGNGKIGKAITGTTNAVLHPIETVEKFNNITESAPRLAEFNRIFNKTGDVQKALDASNNVTVNFARGGDVTKALDRNGVAYLNAGVQGLDKFVRSTKNPRVLANMLIRGGISITAPTVLLAYLNRDDEDYDELTNFTKDGYFCIPIGSGHGDGTSGNGEFIKIPRSREFGVLMGALVERIMRASQGEEQSFKGFGTSLATSFSPANPLTSNMLSPLVTNLPSNKNFMGASIVPQSMIQDGRSKYLQYDEKTSEITKFIAKYAAQAKTPLTPDGIQLSPKQLDYIVDAYTGVIADFVIPATTKGGDVGSVVKKQFVTDSSFSNQAVSDFYDHYDKVISAATDKNITDTTTAGKTTVEEKLKSAISKASTQMSGLSKISLRAGVGTITAEDKSMLAGYGIDSALTGAALQQALRVKRIEIAKEANGLYNNSSTDATALDIYSKSDVGSFKYEGNQYDLTKSEYESFSKTMKTVPSATLKKLEANKSYTSLPDDKKNDMLTYAVNFAEDTAKRKIVESRGGTYKSSDFEKAYKAKQAGIDVADFIDFKIKLDKIDVNNSATQIEAAQAINQTNLSQQNKGKLWNIQNGNPSDKNPFTGALAQYGVAPEKTIAIMEAFDKIDKAIDDNYVKTEGAAGSAQIKAAYFKQWIAMNGYDAYQSAAITDIFTTWQMIPIDKPSKKATAFVNTYPMPK